MTTERTRAAYDRWAVTYDTDPNPQTTLETEDVLDLIDVDDDSRVLDAACGTGRYIGLLQQRGAEVVGLDLSTQMLSCAKRTYPDVGLLRADLAGPLPCKSESFTHVVCAQALKHLPRLTVVLAELARVLVPGGRLVFSVTHPQMDFTDYELGFTPTFVLSREAAVFHHTEADYRAAIAAAGLTLDEWRSVLISEKIEHLLTPSSFLKVRGRAQVAVVRATRLGR
jgi:ubiquinone/menaquinone biosynthesis C-methylase UbiE